MSKPNKVNKSNYDQAGRLTPDELAREHKKQAQVSPGARNKEQATGALPMPRGESDDSRSRNASEE